MRDVPYIKNAWIFLRNRFACSSNIGAIIKRYGNRRLYNTETSSYVNYQDVVKLIRDGHDIQVIDSRTKTTDNILLQLRSGFSS